MKKKLITLAKELDFETDVRYFEYIIESLINGQRQQVRDLFNDLSNYEKSHFLNRYVDNYFVGYYSAEHLDQVREICINELTQ